MAVTCEWALLCREAFFEHAPSTVAGRTVLNVLTLRAIVEHVVTETLPARLSSFALVSHLSEGEAQSVGVRIVSPAGRDLGDGSGSFSYQSQVVDAYLIYRFRDFEFTEEGPHRFEVLADGVVLRTALLPVVVVRPTVGRAH